MEGAERQEVITREIAAGNEGGEAANPDGVVHTSEELAAGRMVETAPRAEHPTERAETSPSAGIRDREPGEGEGRTKEPGAGPEASAEEPPHEGSTEGAGEAAAAEALAAEYRALPGVIPSLVGGSTVAEVKASLEAAKKAYADVKAAVLREQGLAVPAAHSAGGGAAPVPSTPFEMIVAGLQAQAGKGGSK